MKALLFSCLLFSGAALARIEDNSLLLEEAYNQKPGELQLIQTYETFKDERPDYNIELEAPLSGTTHQLAIAFGKEKTFSDVELGYRFQAINVDGKILTEGLRLILPTGSLENESDHGVVGYEWLQSATVIFSEKISHHWNLGVRIYPNAESRMTSDDRTLTNFIGGTSIVYYYRDNFNFLIEGLFQSEENIDDLGEIESEVSFTLSPGIRFGWDLDSNKTQIVPAISFPISFNDEKTIPGIFLYLSLESTLF